MKTGTVLRICMPVAALLLGLTNCQRVEPSQARESVAVMQFLIDSNGMGHFNPPEAFCVAADENGATAPSGLVGQLNAGSARLLDAPGCIYSEERGRVVTADRGTPAVVLWVRSPTSGEETKFAHLAPRAVEEGVAMTLVRAGYIEGGASSASFGCWVVPQAGAAPVVECQADLVS